MEAYNTASARQVHLDEYGTHWPTVLVSAAMTVIIHIYALILMFLVFNFKTPDNTIEELELEIIPPALEAAKPVLPEYVEANPAANMERPEKETNQESFQDQQAAQEIPDPESDDSFPETDGEKEDSKKIVSGDLRELNEASAMDKVFETLDRPLQRPDQGEALSDSRIQMPSPPANIPQTGSETQLAAPQESAQGTDTQSASPIQSGIEDEEGDVAAMNFAETQQQAAPAEILAEDKNSEQPARQEEAIVAQMDLPKPMPRKTVITRTPPGPIANSSTKANRTGVVAVDSKFSEFGAYQHRMVEAIARQWHLLASRYDIGAIYNTQVTIEFFLDHEGEITSYKTTFNSSSPIGRNLCEQAILSTAPYGPWTGEMRAVFGDQHQSVKFTFYYR